MHLKDVFFYVIALSLSSCADQPLQRQDLLLETRQQDHGCFKHFLAEFARRNNFATFDRSGQTNIEQQVSADMLNEQGLSDPFDNHNTDFLNVSIQSPDEDNFTLFANNIGLAGHQISVVLLSDSSSRTHQAYLKEFMTVLANGCARRVQS